MDNTFCDLMDFASEGGNAEEKDKDCSDDYSAEGMMENQDKLSSSKSRRSAQKDMTQSLATPVNSSSDCKKKEKVYQISDADTVQSFEGEELEDQEV